MVVYNYHRNLYKKATIRIYLGCFLKRYSLDLKLVYDKLKEYYQSDLMDLGVDANIISAIDVGPRTVIELFQNGDLSGKKKLIVNPSFSDVKEIKIGCNNVSNIGSFRLWKYEYFMDTFGAKFCSVDAECGNNEACLCPTGFKDGRWCPKAKKRCRNISKYLQSGDPIINSKNELIRLDCLNGSHILNPAYIKYDEFDELDNINPTLAFRCSLNGNTDLIEGYETVLTDFEECPNTISAHIFLIIFVCLLLFVLLKN